MSTIRTQLALHARHHPRRPQRHARLLERAGARRQMLTSAEQLQITITVSPMNFDILRPGSE